MSILKNKIITLGGKEWKKVGTDRVYITNEILNILESELNIHASNYGERNNKIFLDVKTNAIMRSYKNKKPKIQIQY